MTDWVKILEDSSIIQEYKRRGELIGEERGERIGETGGAIMHARRLLLQLGRVKFGPPSPSIMSKIEVIEALERLDELSLRVLTVNSWNDLLAP